MLMAGSFYEHLFLQGILDTRLRLASYEHDIYVLMKAIRFVAMSLPRIIGRLDSTS